MTMDKSLKVRLGLARARSVLTRGERIQRLKTADRWKEGDSPFGLAKVRVYKLAMKKKKKKKEEEEGAEGTAAAAPAADEAAEKDAGEKEAGQERGRQGRQKWRMRVHLEYGRTGLEVDLPDRNVIDCLQYRPADPLPDPAAAVRDCLAHPTGTPPLVGVGPRPPQCLRGHLRRHPPGAQSGVPAAASWKRSKRRAFPRADPPARGHRPAPAQPRRRVGRDGRPRRGATTTASRITTARRSANMRTWARRRAACPFGSTRATSRPI